MTDSSAKICRWLGRAWCSASGSFGIQGSAGSWSVRPGPDGSGRTYSRPRTGPASGRRSAFVRRERSDRPVGWRRAAKPWVRSARLPARVWGFRAMSQLRPGRRPIVSEFLTMSSASVQRVHATWESVARLAERAGASRCRGRLLGWGQVRVPSARGWRARGDTACCRASGSLGIQGAPGSCRVRMGAGGSGRAYSSPRSGPFGSQGCEGGSGGDAACCRVRSAVS